MSIRIATLFLSLPFLAAGQSISLDLTTVPVGITPQSLVAADFNHDGKPDLAVTGSEGSVAILLGNGDGTFRAGQTTAVGAAATRIVKADFNQDGNVDLAVAVGANGQVMVLLGKSDGTFQTPVDSGARAPSGPFTPSNNPTLMAGDFNGDGKIDLILGPYSTPSSSSIDLASTTSMTVLLGKGDGTFQTPVVSNIYPVTYTTTVPVDFYGNGKTEIFIFAYSSANAPAGLITSDSAGKASVTWFNTKPSGRTNQFYALTTADINGNGRADVVAVAPCSLASDGVFTFLDGSVDPVISQLSSCQQSNFYNRVAVADLNGDGKADLLLSDSLGNLFVYRGQGDGTFLTSAPVTLYTGGSWSSTAPVTDVYGSMTTADFRGTGKQDIVMALTGKSVVLLKNGAGAPVEVAAGSVVNAATLTPLPAVAGSVMTIFGSGLSYQSGALQNPNLDRPFYAYSQLFGASVTINGLRAPFIWLSPTQANVQIPWEAAGATQATVIFTRNGTASSPVTIQMAKYTPGLFTMSGEGKGQAAALIVGPNSIPAPAGAFSGSRPVHPGEFVALYGTGFGPVDQPDIVYTGQQPNTYNPFYYFVPYYYPTLQPVTATVGGITATVQFAGLAPGTIGAYQVNVQIPTNAPVGAAVPVTVSIGGVQSQSVTLAIGQ